MKVVKEAIYSNLMYQNQPVQAIMIPVERRALKSTALSPP